MLVPGNASIPPWCLSFACYNNPPPPPPPLPHPRLPGTTFSCSHRVSDNRHDPTLKVQTSLVLEITKRSTVWLWLQAQLHQQDLHTQRQPTSRAIYWSLVEDPLQTASTTYMCWTLRACTGPALQPRVTLQLPEQVSHAFVAPVLLRSFDLICSFAISTATTCSCIRYVC